MKVCRVDEMRAMDKKAITDFGVPADILMENAGEAVYAVIQKELGIKNKQFVIVCGAGNNGGDGFVVARKIHAHGGEVKVFLLAKREKYQDAAMHNLAIISRFPLDIREVDSIEEIKGSISSADAVVDAIFGTGLDRNVAGMHRRVIDLINESQKKVFAIDIASGVNGDNGQIMGAAIRADYTIALGLPKIGNLLYPGYGYGGKLYVSHLSFPPPLYESDALKVEITAPVPLPERNPDTTKMDYGPVLVIAGAASYYWAPHASAYSFLKSGGGYVFLACPKSLAPFVAQNGKEVIFQPQQETSSGSLARENKDALLELSSHMKMVILGPGLSLNEETQELARELTREIEKPLLLDGDGITAVSSDTTIIRERKAATILTPHLGEMARITKMERGNIERNRVGILQETARDLNAVIALKGPHSLVGTPDGRVFINVSGTTGGRAGMAKAGSGDVLNGAIAAMFCLGLPLEEAVRAGVFIHGLAGDLAAKEKGPDGMTAQDILDSLPQSVRYYRENLDRIAANFYDTVYPA
jgi:NAD(P)H-hydrate epimerase